MGLGPVSAESQYDARLMNSRLLNCVQYQCKACYEINDIYLDTGVVQEATVSVSFLHPEDQTTSVPLQQVSGLGHLRLLYQESGMGRRSVTVSPLRR